MTSRERYIELDKMMLLGSDFEANAIADQMYTDDDVYPSTAETGGHYQPPPAELCDPDKPIDPIGVGDVFREIVAHDAWVRMGQWVSGEPIAAATERFQKDAAIIEGCIEEAIDPSAEGEEGSIAILDMSHPGIDEITGVSVMFQGAPEPALIYARRGGLLTMLIFDGSTDPHDSTGWGPGEWTEIVRVALDKLAAGTYTDWPVAEPLVAAELSLNDPGDPSEVDLSTASCTAPPASAPAQHVELDMPDAVAPEVRWTLTSDEAFDLDLLPNDAAGVGVAYTIDREMRLVNGEGQLLWTWLAPDDPHDVDIADKVYAVIGGDEQALVAFDPTTGDVIWATQLMNDNDDWDGVDVAGDTVYVWGSHGVELDKASTTSSPTTAAFDVATGIARWRAAAEFVSGAPDVAILAMPAGEVETCVAIGVDALSGSVRWAIGPWLPADVISDSSVAAVGDDAVFLAWQVDPDESPTVQAIDAASGDVVWTQSMLAGDVSGSLWIAADSDAVYVQAMTDLASFDRRDGSVRWAVDLGAEVSGLNHGIQVRDGEVVIPTETTVIHLSTADGTAIAVEQVPFDWRGELILTDYGDGWLAAGDIALVASKT